jgi:hypothetical protein
MPLAGRRRVRPGPVALPQTVGLQRVKQQLRTLLTLPRLSGIDLTVMQTIQTNAEPVKCGTRNANWGAYSALIPALRAATVSPRRGWYARPLGGRRKAEGRMQNHSNAECGMRNRGS